MALGTVVICFVGVILFAVGIVNIKNRKSFVQNGEETIAEIVDFQTNMDDTWTCVYEYTLPGGRRVIAADPVYRQSAGSGNKKLGKKVKIIYDRENPTKVARKNEFGLEVGFYLMMVMGIVLVFMGIFLIK